MAQALAVREVLSGPAIPVGPDAQLLALAAQLARCEEIVADARDTARAAMRDPDLVAGERRAALGRLRTLVWRVCREILPLVHRVPPGLRAHRAYRDALRASEALRRACEDAMSDHANWQIDLSLERAAIGS